MMGNALIGRLFYSLCKHKVPILFDAPIVDLTGDRRGVKGARLNIGGKEEFQSRPARASCSRQAVRQ